MRFIFVWLLDMKLFNDCVEDFKTTVLLKTVNTYCQYTDK